MMEEVQQEVDTSVPGSPGFVVLVRKPESNALLGYTENSWSMGYEPEYVRFWWTGTGIDNIVGMEHVVDGQKDAERHAEEIRILHPEWQVDVWNVEDPSMPVVIDWPMWHGQRDGSISAPRGQKYADRNPAFAMREDM
jgi:hypothetical protein